MNNKELLIGKYIQDAKSIVKDCSCEKSKQVDIESINTLLSALQIFADDEGLSQAEWSEIIVKATSGIPGAIKFRPTVA